MVRKTLVINGVTRNLVLCKDETLATVLREHLLLTGCKIGCGEGHCGACNVIMNGKVTKACIVKMSKVPDNAAAPRASSSAQRFCSKRIRTPPAKKSATGSTRPATCAAAPATSRWLTPSWPPLP